MNSCIHFMTVSVAKQGHWYNVKVRGGIHAEVSRRDDLLDRPVSKCSLSCLLVIYFLNTLMHTSILNAAHYKVNKGSEFVYSKSCRSQVADQCWQLSLYSFCYSPQVEILYPLT